jgi:hypothetical protein
MNNTVISEIKFKSKFMTRLTRVLIFTNWKVIPAGGKKMRKTFRVEDNGFVFD